MTGKVRAYCMQVCPLQQGGGGANIDLGCITFYGPGDLCRINGTMNTELYLELLHVVFPAHSNDVT